MAKLTRVTQKIFGSSAGTDQIAQFGSLAAGSPAFTTDPAVAQALTNWLNGWFGAVIGGNAPAIEDMNSVLFVYAYQLAYIMQAGIPEWDSGTTYYIGSFVNIAGVAYVSRTDTNLNNNPASDTTNWKKIGGDIMSALGDLVYGGAAGAATKLPGNTSATPALLAQTGDGLGSSAAPVWRSIQAPTQQVFTSGSGTYTKPANVVWIRVRMVGGGGGGGGGGAGATNGSTGSASTFGTSLLSAGGGNPGATGAGAGGLGGSSSLGIGPTGLALQGGQGGGGDTSSSNFIGGGMGGSSALGGAGGSGQANGAGAPGAPNTGGGGGGGGSAASNGSTSGSGGGSGGFIDAVISNPSSTYAYVVGSGGAAGSGGSQNGGAGADGIIIVEEHYQ